MNAIQRRALRGVGEYVARNGLNGLGLGATSLLAWGGLIGGAYVGYKYSKNWRILKAIGLGLLGNWAGATIGASFMMPDQAALQATTQPTAQ